jgi:hypothetical protein
MLHVGVSKKSGRCTKPNDIGNMYNAWLLTPADKEIEGASPWNMCRGD